MILAILLLANLINYMDRYTIAGVLEDVQNYYAINNAQVGLLQTSFIISYMLFSPLFGYLGDRYNRKWAMIGGILFWSVVTFLGSFVPPGQFGLFVFLRTMVGVGEASYSTIAPTIIADMFSNRKRTMALSIFYFAIPVGSGLGYIIGSTVANAAGAWYWALRVTPILGLVCTFLMIFLVKEPKRGESDGGTHLITTSYYDDLLYLLKHKSFMLSSFGFTCVAFVAGALSLWAPLYVYRNSLLIDSQRHPHTSPSSNQYSMSFIFGVITCVAGLAGVLGGYYAASKLRPYSSGADALVCAVGLIAGAPFLYLALVFSRGKIAVVWLLIFLAETLISLNWALVTDILLYTVIPTRRSAAEAFQILLSHALGDAGSPYIVGLISDSIESGYEHPDPIVQYFSLQYAMYMTCFVCVIGGAFFLATALYVKSDKEKADRMIRS
ncbi:hypothetical protein HELRODRAFT_88291 [Helobdella robusta]|uniref:Major facilitator superfamily (MFS) profile domain-containing protein n=1 Tax=Helobdella robusta TaxID=6412 RepID=T1G712_HELRO|nr:hypothetical protein HELRODRAFT_88291 [Helobdella robusta]ESN93752.1 hypothetical protein HELRODRAFT_88291 [Helobdella robusta]